MTYLDITAFLEVIKAGSFSGAAEVLYITQPALSRRIMFLEHEVGCTLFYRGKGIRQAQLTTAGKAFVPIAERLRSAWKMHLIYPGYDRIQSSGSQLLAASEHIFCSQLYAIFLL